MLFTMLGSGAVRDNVFRGGPAQVLEVGEEVWMFDAGRSAATNLAKAGYGCETVDRLFLTHLHFDHIVDLPYIVLVGWVKERANQLRVYGPEGTNDFVTRVLRPPFEQDIQSRMGHGKDDSVLDPAVMEAPSTRSGHATGGAFLDEDGVKVATTFTDHGGIPTLVYRIDAGGKRVVITGDGTPDDAFPEFCKGADLLAIECSGTSDFLETVPWGSWHITPPDIGRIATEAGVKRVLIKHLVEQDVTHDRRGPQRMAEQIREGFKGEVIVGEDGLRIDI